MGHFAGTGNASRSTASGPVAKIGAARDVNEQSASGRAFYAARGFVEVGRSEVDDEGRPFPVLRLQFVAPKSPARPA
ncbi:hypothetical protein CQ020_22075 [Arthrobacter sp. MYb23]|uniref:hypothetical protein n=1 Tax=unclassified Arthrobacter TaxID=235627 RepID=UPI000CFB6DDB|nr:MULTISPECIES: hypothetical protein [unclassified Arthrobacter]PRB36093.1 hypothetical protein CQ038_21780 [Arthrobacter sp. MYb51]PRB90002.1 hypothetical protein CQ020_22075 [Arthrobacter sp. MYb23]